MRTLSGQLRRSSRTRGSSLPGWQYINAVVIEVGEEVSACGVHIGTVGHRFGPNPDNRIRNLLFTGVLAQQSGRHAEPIQTIHSTKVNGATVIRQGDGIHPNVRGCAAKLRAIDHYACD